MKIIKIENLDTVLQVRWQDETTSVYPYIWLRDNDPLELHPDTHERLFDLCSVEIGIKPISSKFDQGAQQITIEWPAKAVVSVYSSKWLYEHQLGRPRFDPAAVTQIRWTRAEMTTLPRFSAAKCHSSQNVLLTALRQLKESGIVLIDHLDDAVDAGEKFGDLIGFKRETNYGVMFDVESKPNPNNLAYTSLALPLHTDLPNQEFVPGNQFLHCYRNSATGGGSMFADGLAIINDFKKRCPDYYRLLTQAQVPWRFTDEKTDLRQHRPVIGLNPDGSFKGLTFNAHLVDAPDFEPKSTIKFYAAFQALMKHIRTDEYIFEQVLKPGEMVVFDNQRVLHGRAAFDPNSGERHLRGYYIEHNEVNNRIRMLSKQV